MGPGLRKLLLKIYPKETRNLSEEGHVPKGSLPGGSLTQPSAVPDPSAAQGCARMSEGLRAAYVPGAEMPCKERKKVAQEMLENSWKLQLYDCREEVCF